MTLTILALMTFSAHAAKDMCETGKKQSPIDITDYTLAFLEPIAFISQPVNNIVHVKKTNYIFVPQSEIVLSRADKRHKLLEFHMHNPAEHRIKNHLYPMEIHLVFDNGPDDLLVVAQFVTKGPNNPMMDELLYSMAMAANEVGESRITFEMDPTKLIGEDLRYYEYQGSLTTPPCGENVTFLVLEKPIAFAPMQIKDFYRINGLNSRIPQPLNGRTIYGMP